MVEEGGNRTTKSMDGGGEDREWAGETSATAQKGHDWRCNQDRRQLNWGDGSCSGRRGEDSEEALGLAWPASRPGSKKARGTGTGHRGGD